MPTYAYRCADCGKEFEVVETISEHAPAVLACEGRTSPLNRCARADLRMGPVAQIGGPNRSDSPIVSIIFAMAPGGWCSRSSLCWISRRRPLVRSSRCASTVAT